MDQSVAQLRPEPAHPGVGSDRTGPQLSVIVPTRNEHDNVAELVARLDKALAGLDWEAIFVDDDSTDGTADLVREIGLKDARVRVLQRLGRRGLSSACIEGILSSSAPFVAVIDADMQHDETLLPQMYHNLVEEDLDVVVGSRYMEGGSTGTWSQSREDISRFAKRLAEIVLKIRLTDPMSGFFALRRSTFEEVSRSLSGRGFKILLDIFASAQRPLKYRELPYHFRNRTAGESKLDSFVSLEYLALLLEKTLGRVVPVRFLLFSFVGGTGVVVNLGILWAGLSALSFPLAQSLGTFVAMVSNFSLNNLITYRDSRLRGWAWVRGLATFVMICSLGSAANVGIASMLFYSQDASWWLSGLAGTAVGTVWNYAMSATFTWRRPVT